MLHLCGSHTGAIREPCTRHIANITENNLPAACSAVLPVQKNSQTSPAKSGKNGQKAAKTAGWFASLLPDF